jgi:hydrogenase expression/formation protein HypD
MMFLDERRDPDFAARTLAENRRIARHRWSVMEVCGGQTHAIPRSGLQDILPPEIELAHGPGFRATVAPPALIDKAVAIAGRDVILCSLGDLLSARGSGRSLLEAKAGGADVRMVYSPLDAVRLARLNPGRQVVFCAAGFETTAPANAMAVWQAAQEGLRNFSIMVAHALAPPAMEAILDSADSQVDAFLAPGHVCTTMGRQGYERLVARHRLPVVVTGFEPLDLLEGIRMAVAQLEAGRAELEDQYGRAVRREENREARELIGAVFEKCAGGEWWTGSGLRLRPAYLDFDAELRFAAAVWPAAEPELCVGGEIRRGLRKPEECAAFASRCTPETPLGASMVSAEGACAVYYAMYNKKKTGVELLSEEHPRRVC